MDSSADLVSSGSLVPRITVGANGLVYVGNGASDPSQGKFYGLTANLQTMWSVTATYNYYCGPALGQNGILVVCGGGTSITAYYTPVGITGNENNSPEGSYLYQNYPNPFNAKSKIKYQISKTSQVKIQVFDMLGRMLETLANERKNAGQYELILDAGDLPSGNYFYRLESDGYVETRKMILLK